MSAGLYWQNSLDSEGKIHNAWVAYVNTGPRGEQGPSAGSPLWDRLVLRVLRVLARTFPDAPADGTNGRKDNAWVHVVYDVSGDYNDLTNKPTIGDGGALPKWV